MATGDPEIIILSSSDEESKPQVITPQGAMQFSKKQKKSGYPATQVKSVSQAQSRCSLRSQAVNILKHPMMSKNRTKIIAVPALKNQNVTVNKKIPQLSPNSAKSKTYYPSQQLQSAKLVNPQKNFDITKSVLNTQNFSSKNNIVSKISSQPVVRTSTPKPSNQNQPVLKFGSNLTITSKSAEVRQQSSNKTTVSPSVISALKKKGISVTNVYEDDISNVQIPKISSSTQNDLNNLRNKLLKSHVNIDVVPKTTNNASSCVNPTFNSNKSPQVSTQGLKRKYSNLDAVSPSSAPSAKKVANYSNRNLVNPSSSEHIKKMISSSKNLSIHPVKNIPLKNGSQIKVVERPVMLSNSLKKPPNVVHHNSQITNSKNCFVPKTYLKHPEKALSSSSLQQTTSKRQVSIIPIKSSQSNIAKENLDKTPQNSQSNLVKENSDKKSQSSRVNDKKSVLSLEATDLKNNLSKQIDSDLIVCYSSFPPSKRSPSRRSARISSITKLPAPKVPDSKIPLQQTTLPLKETTLPLKQTTLPLKQTTLPLKQTTLPLKQTTLPLKKATLPLKKTTLHSSIKQSKKIHCKKIDLSKDRSALLDLLALCDDTHSSSISKKRTSSGKPVKNNLNAAVTVIPLIDKILSSCEPRNNIIESMKVHEIKDRTRNWPKLVVSLERLNLGPEYMKNLSTEPIIKTLDSNNEITIHKRQLTEEVNHPKPSCSQLSSDATESLVSCSNIKSVHRSVDKDVLTEVKDKGLQNPVILNNSQQSCGSVTIPLSEPVDKCSVLSCLSTAEKINLSDSNHKPINENSQLSEELKSSNSNASQLSSNATESLANCPNMKSVHRSVDKDVLTEVKDKGLQNPVILNNSQQSCGSVTIPFNGSVDECSVLSCLLTAERIDLSDSNRKPTNENSQLSKEQKSSNSNSSQLSTNIISEQVECSSIKTVLQAVDSSGCLLKAQNKKLENIIVLESTHQNKNSDTNSLNMHIDEDTNKILSTNVASKQAERSVIKELLLQPIDIDLAKDKHLLNSVVSESTQQNKKSDASIINSQVDSNTNKSISMKPIIKTVNLSDFDCDKKMQFSKELKGLKEVQMNLELHTDSDNIQSLHPLTYNQVESSELKSRQKAFDMNDSSKIKETDFQNSHQSSNGCATDFNKHKDTCVDKKLSNQLVVKVLNLPDSDIKLDTKKVQENVELEHSNDIELSASVTNSPAEFSNVNPIQQAVDNAIALPNAGEAKLCTLRKLSEASLSDSDSKLGNEKVEMNEELVSSNEIESSANVTNSTITFSNVNPIHKAVDNVIALPWFGKVSDINEPNLMISENSQSNGCVTNTLEETEDSSNLKSSNVAHSSSRENICEMVNSPIASVISSDSSCFSLNEDINITSVISPDACCFSLDEDIKMTLIDRPHNVSHAETLDMSDVDHDLLDKSANNTTKSLDEKKDSEFSEIVKQPSLLSSLSPDVSASVIVKNLLRNIISNVEEFNSKNNSMRSNVLKATEDSNSVVPKCETVTKVCKKSVTDSVKSKSEEVAEEKESRISNCILDPVYSKCFVVDNTLEKEINATKLHSNEDSLLCPSTSKQPDSESKNIVDQDCKKPLCSNIDTDSQLNITAAAFFPCTEAAKKSCSEAPYNSADDEHNECDIKIVSVMSTARSNVTNDLSVVSPPSSGETNDDSNYELRETKSSTVDTDKGTTGDDETKRELSDQFKNNVMSESENDKMGSSKHILDFQDDSNISGPLHADEGLSCIIANVGSKRDTVVENEQNFNDFPDESEFRENLFNDDNDYESMDSDYQVTATGLKSLSSEESASITFVPAVADGEEQTLNQSNSTQVTSPKLSLKRNRNIESPTPNHAVEEKDSVKRIKLLDSSLSSDVIHEQSSSNFSIVPSFSINTDEKNKKRFMELLEFSKTLMEETSETEKEKIVEIMQKKLNETELWYAGSEKFSTLIDKTLLKLTDPNENVFSVLQGVRKEFKKYKCKFKPTFIKENNTDTNSGGCFLPIKISAVEGNTDSSSLADIRYRPKKRPSLLDEETHNFSNLKNSINGFTLNSVSSLSQIDYLPAKISESLCNDHEIGSDLQSTSFHSALQETFRNLDCTADKAILDPKSVSLASSSQNFTAEKKAPSVLQERLPSKSPLPAVCEERTSVRNLCASPSIQSHSSALDSSKPCLTTDKKEVKLCSSVDPSNFEPLPSCSYNVDSNSSSLQNLSSERTSNKKPDWDGGTSLSLSSCIPMDKINDTLSVLNKEKSIKEIIHEPENSRQQRRIKKLEKLLEQLDKKIKKLQEKELSLDDLDDEESAYILEDKYVRRFKQAWDTLCKLKKQPSRTGRIVEKKFKYEGTRFKEINTGIEKMINKRKAHEKFPDFVEVLTLIKNVNDVHDIGLNERSVQIEAERVFKDIGRELQIRRMRDHEELFGCHLTDGMDLSNDPAEHNEELKKVLRANSHKFEESINKVIDSYAEKQRKMPEGEDDQDDKNSSDNEEDADEVQDVEEVDKEDLPLTDPGSDASGSDKKPKKDIVEIIYDSDKSTDPNEELKAKEKAKPEQQTTVNKSNLVLDVIDLGHDSDSMGELPSIQELMSSR